MITNQMPEAQHALTFLISFNHFCRRREMIVTLLEKKCAYLLTICHTVILYVPNVAKIDNHTETE
jgi:hypothetical protein